MVGVGGGDDCHPRAQPVEGTVELVSLDDDVVGIRQDVVRTIVLGDAAEEGVAVEA